MMSSITSPNNDKQGVGIPVNSPGGGWSSPTGIPVNMNTQINNQRNNSNGSGNQLTQAQAQLLQQQQQSKYQQMTPQQQQQQKQRMLLQQRAMQQQRHQQAMQNYENQFYQLLMTLNKRPKRLYNFVEDTDSILKKYEQYRPSFEFHIYENNYKICAPANTRLQQQEKSPELSNDGLVLNKNNETLKEFLEYVARGIIPEAIMEVLRDCNIQFYEGNLVLQVYDHTNTVDVIPKDPAKQGSGSSQPDQLAKQEDGQVRTPQSNSSNPQNNDAVKKEETSSGPSPDVQHQKERHTSFRRPRVYRTLLRPNDLTHYYDMMTYADQARFSDSIYQQLESELLILTKRNVNLDVKLNPFEHKDKLDDNNFTTPEWDENKDKLNFVHRGISKSENTKGVVGHIKEHEELPQHNSTYEQLMLIMSERTSTTTSSAFAAALAKHATEMQVSNNGSGGVNGSKNISGGRSNGNSLSEASQVSMAAASAAAAVASNSSNENNQFGRLKFIEQYRINKEKRKQQEALNIANGSGHFSGDGNNGSGVGTPFNMKISMTMPSSEQQHLSPQQQQLQQLQKQQQLLQQASQNKNGNRRNNNADKSKARKPRKPKKGAEAPKKKRVTKKKSNTTANGTPGGMDDVSIGGTPANYNSTASPGMMTPKH